MLKKISLTTLCVMALAVFFLAMLLGVNPITASRTNVVYHMPLYGPWRINDVIDFEFGDEILRINVLDKPKSGNEGDVAFLVERLRLDSRFSLASDETEILQRTFIYSPQNDGSRVFTPVSDHPRYYVKYPRQTVRWQETESVAIADYEFRLENCRGKPCVITVNKKYN